MWSNVFSKTSSKRWSVGLVLAFLLSLLVHLLILGSEYWHLPALTLSKSTVSTQQVFLQAAPLPVPSPQPKPAPVKKTADQPHPVKPHSTAPELVVPEVQQSIEPVIDDTSAEADMNQVIDAPVMVDDAVQAQPGENQEEVAEIATVVSHDVPSFSYVDTEFVVLRGINGSKVGVTKISYRMQADGQYELISTTEAKGLAALVVSGKLLQNSVGKVTENGLLPEYFSYQYGKGDSKKQQSRFDWQQHQVTLETAKGIKTVDLPEGTQDILSFMYQFIFVPPLEELNLHISNGKKLSEYSYSFEGEETLETEFGALRAWHIARAGDDGSEKTELWLAVDYHYLPVKMRKTEEDGSVIEQVATQISTDLLK